ncbi:Putative histidine phosphatase superfamily, clade-1 [Colletotrichum destructivum]|uniref:Histidine phosphatase superfamily, clade-1 n=1 Tax=Colletotrichum destructivum TaxID=34406 RepID=A0AAX4IFW7_9PEZI|nr:Putative histidine phosphatase superfamily, clade-1 [Colletotrichum destructivum]
MRQSALSTSRAYKKRDCAPSFPSLFSPSLFITNRVPSLFPTYCQNRCESPRDNDGRPARLVRPCSCSRVHHGHSSPLPRPSWRIRRQCCKALVPPNLRKKSRCPLSNCPACVCCSAGSRDSPLTSHGVLQARRLGAHLAARTASASAGITHIFSSTLRRASTTAAAVREAVASSHHSSAARDIRVVRLSDLREKHFGTGEGQKFGGTTAFGTARPRHDGAEDLHAMRVRAKRFVDGYLAPIFACVDAEPGGAAESIIIVAHGIILGVLSSVLCGPGLFAAVEPHSESQRPWSWSNTGFVEIRVSSMPVASDLARASHDALLTVRWPRLSLQTISVNCTEHLAGLKKTRGGIGSAKFDEKQKTIISFFAPAPKKRKD